MANLQARGGSVKIRVGGNTQETAALVQSLPDGKVLEKDLSGVTNPVCMFPNDLDAHADRFTAQCRQILLL